jgi:hypothetical protein
MSGRGSPRRDHGLAGPQANPRNAAPAFVEAPAQAGQAAGDGRRIGIVAQAHRAFDRLLDLLCANASHADQKLSKIQPPPGLFRFDR